MIKKLMKIGKKNMGTTFPPIMTVLGTNFIDGCAFNPEIIQKFFCQDSHVKWANHKAFGNLDNQKII